MHESHAQEDKEASTNPPELIEPPTEILRDRDERIRLARLPPVDAQAKREGPRANLTSSIGSGAFVIAGREAAQLAGPGEDVR
jgi:hypothetical protein